jgi:predicted nucleic acid-binding protein
VSYVVLDTDVTSYAFKHRDLPAPIVEAVLHNRLCITFVTLAELTKWSVRRKWSPAYRQRLHAWLANVFVLPYNNEIEDVARTWGNLAAYAEERGRPAHKTTCGSQPAAFTTTCPSPPSTSRTSVTSPNTRA